MRTNLFFAVLVVFFACFTAIAQTKSEKVIDQSVSPVVNGNVNRTVPNIGNSKLNDVSAISSPLGNPCTAATEITATVENIQQTYSINDAVTWFKFTANSLNVRVFVNNFTNITGVTYIYMYSGVCDNPILVSYGILEEEIYNETSFDGYNLTIGDNYFIKVKKENLSYSEFKMSLQNIEITNTKSLCSSNKWTSVGIGTAFNGVVYAMAKVGNYLYAGGTFTQISPTIQATNLAKWDGANWSPVDLGSNGVNGVDGFVRTLFASGNVLYIGGTFTHVGSIPLAANNIASWDGSNWNTLGLGVQGPISRVLSISEFQNEIYVGGSFTRANNSSSVGDTIKANNIAKWNGSWSTYGAGASGYIFTFCTHMDKLYAAGNFTYFNNSPMNRVVVLNGSTWSQAGNGIQVSGTVNTLASYQNKLYAAGTLGPNTDPHKIYKMDENVWSQAEIIEGDVYSSIVFDNKLYLGGLLQNINNVPLKYIAYYDNSLWRMAGDGLNGSPYSLSTFPNSASQDELYASGVFANTGSGYSAIRIAKLCPCALAVTATAQNASNSGAADGSASVTVINPNGLYYFHWSNGATTQTITGLVAGTYTVTVDDSNGCIASDTTVVSVAVQSGAICTVATFLPPATYNPTDTAFQITGTEYWMKFTADTNSIRIAINNSTDTNAADIKKMYLYTGDCNNLQLLAMKDITQGDNLEIIKTDLIPGVDYLLLVEQPLGGTGWFRIAPQKYIDKPCLNVSLLANAGQDITIQLGENANIGTTAILGMSYNWSPSIGLSNSNISNPIATPTLTTTYYVTMTDVNGCSDADAIVITVGNDQGNITPDGIFDNVFDQYGNQYKLADLMIVKKLNADGIYMPISTAACTTSTGYFDLYIEQGSGMEGSSPDQTNRRNVICQLFSDISAFINSPLLTNGLGNKVNIWVRDIAQIPNVSSSAAALATSFCNVPVGVSSVTGIADNEVWKTINSGFDSYTNVASPLVTQGGENSISTGTFFHGMMAFNFSNSNWHTLLNPNTSSSNIDLYTIALHELVHVLGFASLINGSGESKFGTAQNYYSRYDLFLKDPSNNFLITKTGNCHLYNYHFTSNVAFLTYNPTPFNCLSQIKFAGSVNQKVYTPAIFSLPSSLSHFEDQCHAPIVYPDNSYYVMSDSYNLNNPLVLMKRFLKPEERSVLCDLNYNVNTIFGSSANNNYYDYGGSACPSLQVAGINDGINSDGIFTWVTTGTTPINITANGFLSNDLNATEFECLEDVYGMGTINVTTGIATTVITYTPTIIIGGTALLRYIPKNSISGNKGNITYIYIRVNSTGCIASPCNMINNGEFESTTVNCGSQALSANQVNCWSSYTSTPDLYGRNCSYNIPNTGYCYAETWNSGVNNNNHFIGLYGMQHNNIIDEESVQTALSAPIMPNNQYIIRFWAFVAVSDNNPVNIAISGSQNTLPNTGDNYNIDNLIILIPSIIIPTNGIWNLIEIPLSYNNINGTVLSNLIIGNDASIYPNVSNYVFIDGVELFPVSNVPLFNPPTTVCINQVLSDLSAFALPPNGTFSGSGVTYANGIYSFNASIAGIGPHIITYSFTNNFGCLYFISKSFVVINSSLLINVLTTNNSCLNSCDGSAIVSVISGTSPFNYIWNDAESQTNSIATDLCVGNYTVTVTDANNCVQVATTTITQPVELIITEIPATRCGIGSVTLSVSSNTGTTINWYEASVGGSSLGSNTSFTTPIISATTIYYVDATNNGCVSAPRIPIVATVLQPPITDFSIITTPPNTCITVGNALTINNTTQPNTNISYLWDWGDNNTSTINTPNIILPAEGNYNISLTASNSCGSSTHNELIYVYPNACSCPTGSYPGYVTISDIVYNSPGIPVTWSTDMVIEGTVHINSGSTLIISSSKKIYFGPKGRIIVDRDALLDIKDKALLTSLNDISGANCPVMWQGIEVWGISAHPSTDGDHVGQGIVKIANTAQIKNAHIAVLLGKRNMNVFPVGSKQPQFDKVFSGGIIKADRVVFIDNGVSIWFTAKYPSTFAQNSSASSIIGCNFSTVSSLLDPNYSNQIPNGLSATCNPYQYPNPHNPFNGFANNTCRSVTGIRQEMISDVIIVDNTFDNIEVAMDAYDAKFDVTQGSFVNSLYGIRINNTISGISNTHKISDITLFDNFHFFPNPCLPLPSQWARGAAISINAGINDVIENNIFGKLSNPNSSIGNNFKAVSLSNTSRFSVTNNQFILFNYGVTVDNSSKGGGLVGANNNGFPNVFTKCNIAITTTNNNSHLKLRCNNHDDQNISGFSTNWYNSGSLATQGSSSGSSSNNIDRYQAGNKFLHPDINHRKISTSSGTFYFNYFRHSVDENGIPENVTPTPSIASVMIHNTGIPKTNTSCLPIVEITYPSQSKSVNSGTDPIILLAGLNSKLDSLKQRYTQLLSSLDNGNTTQLLTAINENMPTGQLKNLLIANSPLSDDVLIPILQNANALSPGNLKLVMEKNLPVTDNVQPTFISRLSTLPSGIADQLRALQVLNVGCTTINSILREIELNEMLRNQLLASIMQWKVSEGSEDEAIQILETQGTAEANVLLAATYLSDGNYAEARNKLMQLTSSDTEISDFKLLTYMLIDLGETDKTLYELDATQLQIISDLSVKCPSSLATANAQAILTMLYNVEFQPCENIIARYLNNMSISGYSDANVSTESWYLGNNFPNPYNSISSIPYYLPYNSKGKIIISDINGVDLKEFALIEGYNTLQFVPGNLASGVYIYRLVLDGIALQNKKMTIIK